ncbi:membrane protein insertase YidC [Paenibacillus doosanensis]|uniref:Membrane protein insertase YidC n=1 Tax=Paenibacillus konkukensis TaxID=2020716 RepID=A0ABY4RJJ0_9BACL|nr:MULTISPECIES: membrane protein insertase YidC [Paenibacillus]MCS7460648.1 membrane protein insertase YidC [Paenibacillus doosanensis]UQZ82629.1 Membrane protein insertase MisCB precursor [Paenibacillus konkukensis]
MAKKNNGFTRFKIIGLLTALAVLLIVSGCGVSGPNAKIDASTPGMFNHYIVYPFSYLIQHLATFFDGSYGLGLIVLTLMVRLVLLPLMMRQYRSQHMMKQKMNALQPELKQLQDKYKDKNDAESKTKLQQETMQLYQKHQVNPLAVGCLPMLIQLPILSGLYYAIKLTPELADHSFLWFQLGKPDMVLPFVAAIIYYFQYKVSQIGVDPAQQKQFALIAYVSPIMMAVFSFSAPAAVPLYWVVGGIFVILQTLLAKKIYHVKAVDETNQPAESKA